VTSPLPAPPPGRLEAFGRALAALGLGAHALFAPVSIAATQIGLGAALLGILLCALAGRRPRRTPLDLALALFVVAALLSTALAREGPGAPMSFTLWRHAAGFWIATQALWLASDVRRAAARTLALAAAGLIAASLVGLVQYRTGFDLVHALHLREQARLVAAPGVPGRFAAMGFFISRLTFGHCATVLVALFAGAALFGELASSVRALLAAAIATGLVAILLTFDRAAWLGLLAAALALGAAGLAQRRARASLTDPPARTPARRVALAAGALALLCASATLVPGVRARFASGFDVQQNQDRVFLWSRALEIIRDHPLAGVGFGNYPRVCPRYYDRVDPAFPMRTWAHNSLLSLWAETGLAGLCALAFLIFAVARALRDRLRAQGLFTAGALAAVCALAVIAQVHDVVYDSKVMYPLWLALALGLHPSLSLPGKAPGRA